MNVRTLTGCEYSHCDGQSIFGSWRLCDTDVNGISKYIGTHETERNETEWRTEATELEAEWEHRAEYKAQESLIKGSN